jgi:hypothetical protein
VLDGLCCRQEPGVGRGRASEVLHDFLAFVDQTLDRIASLAARGFLDNFEDLLETPT